MYVVLKRKPSNTLVASSPSIEKIGEKKLAIAEAERLAGSPQNVDCSEYLVFRAISCSGRTKSPVRTVMLAEGD